MKVLLTSCGLETENIKNKFMEFLDKEISEVKAVFIPTAAVKVDAINVLPKCMNDLLKCGISKNNIFIYDLHRAMTENELLNYDVVYICGGDIKYLLDRVNENGFRQILQKYINADKIVVGVSAGSVIFAGNLEDNLGFIKQRLDVHCDEGQSDKTGDFDLAGNEVVRLSNRQALVLESKEKAYIIG